MCRFFVVDKCINYVWFSPPVLDNDKENDNRTGSGQSTQGVIQRRRRPKRRSTGVVHIDMDVSTVYVTDT